MGIDPEREICHDALSTLGEDDASPPPLKREAFHEYRDSGPRVGIAPPQEGFATVAWSTLSVDQLRRAEVYDVDNERVSGISDILFGADGSVEAVLIDVGGFLGMGQRSVAIAMDQLEIQGKMDLSDLRVYLAITQQQLEALPEHVSN